MYWYIIGHHIMYWYILGHHVMCWYIVGYPIGAGTNFQPGIKCTILNSELGCYVLSQFLSWDIMYHYKF